MLLFIARRFIQSILVMIVVAGLAFVMFTFIGDPVNQMVGIETTPEQRAELRERLGLNDPVHLQFGRFMLAAARFDFGISYQYRIPVSELIADRAPATLELSLISVLLSLLLGIPFGVYTALKRHAASSHALMALSLAGVSLPTFLIGILLIYIFAIELGWLPSSGRGETVAFGWWDSGLFTRDGLEHLLLPALTLALFQMTLVMRLVRAEMLEVMRTDYIKFARARGIKTRSVHFSHALKNTLVPVITIIGLQMGAVVAFAIITETVFNWPGMGRMFIQAVQDVDIPVMAAYLMLVALIIVAINLAVDILYVVVDPRIRVET